MTQFRFRLHSLLELREALEKMQGRELGVADGKAQDRRDESVASESQLLQVQAQAGHAEVGDTHPAGNFHAMALTVAAARQRAIDDAAALAEAEARRAEELARYNEARTARRALEKLRDRREADWQVDEGRRERAETDEVARRTIADRGKTP
ncbi:MAG TPA: flagellar FliJ family protein [Gemmatimonadales bacterium]|jgi:flagellar export protein FliJ